MKERCSCGSYFKYDRPATGSWDTSTAERLLKEWRENHRHEFAPAHDDPPFIDETSARVELAPRYPLGFAVEPWEEQRDRVAPASL